MSGRPGYAVIANTSKQAEIVPAWNVTLSGGTNATVSGGATNQPGLTGAMTAVTYTANSGCKFPETSDYYKETNGITVARTSDTVVTVSGTPTANASITIPDAVLAHTHSFTYSASGATITATCSVDGCPLDDGTDQHKHTATLTIAAPLHTTFGDGKDAAATITDANSIQGTATVSYYAATKADDAYTKTGSALGSAPTDAGDYWAEITLGTDLNAATAGIGYTIAKVAETDPAADTTQLNINYP